MIVETSALTAILKGEAERDRCLDSIRQASVKRISAANLLGVYMVIDRSGLPDALDLVDQSIRAFSLLIEPVTAAQVVIARGAFHRFGKGNRHGAGLNFGDCFAYALAKATGEPLLFVGNDFGKTDIGIA